MAEQRTVNPLVVGSSPTLGAMINQIKHIIFPDDWDYDIRPIIIFMSAIFLNIAFYTRSQWKFIKKDIDSDWEL